MTPTLVALRTSVPFKWAGLAWGGPALAAFDSQ